MDKNRFYYNKKFLSSRSGRPIRFLSEYFSPLESLRRKKIRSTVVFFGSARIRDNNDNEINKYYKKAKNLAYKITKWNLENFSGNKYVITSGAGPGIMAAANQGAMEAKGKSIGFGGGIRGGGVLWCPGFFFW